VRPLQRAARKGLRFGTGSGTFIQPSHWAADLIGDTSTIGAPSPWGTPNREEVENSFEGYVTGAYKRNGIVFACVQARARAFSEARFQYQSFESGRPGRLFGAPSLALLENPWPNGTTGELLTRMEQDVSLAGNFFATTAGDGTRIRRLRPDWVTIITGSPSDDPFHVEAEVLGYIYDPQNGSRPVLLTTDKVVHWSPIPDPDAQWRGMSWLTPVLREIEGDTAATKHKLKFFENAAVAPFVITYDAGISNAAFQAFVQHFKDTHQGTDNAYKTLHLGGGADPKTLGADFKQLDFKVTQGAGETRIAAAAGAHPVIVGLSEGMSGSSLNQGNFNAAKRLFADITIRPNWRSASAALSKFTAPPSGSRLWYDDRDIPFLKEDQQDAAQILSTQATAIRQLLDAGFAPDEAVKAVTSGDLASLAGKHSGLYSVQLQPAGSRPADTAPAA
jgi:phage portal protein BeeE